LPAQNFATGLHPNAVVASDVNGDGKLDLVAPNRNANTVSVLLGNGNGSFQNAANFATGPTPIALAVADVNGDGRPDLAIPNYSAATVSVLLGQANAATHFLLTAPATATAGTPFALTVRALDAAGTTDARYTGTVAITSSDDAFAPFTYTFRPSDTGVHTFNLPLTTKRLQPPTVTDLAQLASTGNVTVLVG